MSKQKLQLMAIVLILSSIVLKVISGLQFLAFMSGLLNALALITAIIAVGLGFWLVTRNSKY
ncbi:hypothetical protein [Lentilactobacillus kosonis]|uniref:Uncharacterized protein n=1 Tax=Lentilactobacillus kosonis TaxID=2810561 RepID=A0A401FI60_9LACO|nr:hypothetical protein [Lentilactobacillus kosonis]GAY72053.1 hypothetical protein NBRC111893_199 [Lentilactobacillus kosonis]